MSKGRFEHAGEENENNLEKGNHCLEAAAENEFFAEVWQSQKDFADIAIPFWAGAQTSNAGLGRAHAATLK